MALLVLAWGAALAQSDLATASDGVTASEIPNVPSTAFEQPASVQATPSGIDQRAGAAGTVSTLSSNGIPSAALYAYRRAETLLGKADKSCHLPWNLVAAIGRVESNHGRINGNALNAKGVAKPGIYGVALDGRDGRAKISDTDSGSLDKSPIYDRAVGPMQFIPATWKTIGVDSDNDNKKNVQDIDDAATSAGIYLCAGSDDVSKRTGAAAAVGRYNHSSSYVDLVLSISAMNAKGDFTQSPNGFSTAPVLTSAAYDQTLTPAQRNNARKAEQKANSKPKTSKNDGGGGSTGTGGGTTGGGTGGGTSGGTGTGTGTGGTGTGSGSVSDGVDGLLGGALGDLTGGGTADGGTTAGGTTTGGTTSGGSTSLTSAEAEAKCVVAGVSTHMLDACIMNLLN
ncbi:lytic transglycosylase domain-containing protein [Aeromicrobium sp.]|uniref:lytic transglycosylase domain-containing protein n=1 Tax=Aeromicrobium sp. TaxID=1871063 RepID=UPI0025C34C76|nr:lytic transglycosylase domain-containing protein [Aeromicrobium sp.]